MNRYRIANEIVAVKGEDGQNISPNSFGGPGTSLTDIILKPGAYIAFARTTAISGNLTPISPWQKSELREFGRWPVFLASEVLCFQYPFGRKMDEISVFAGIGTSATGC